jgi:Flp pilus assembly protein TadG
MSRLRRRRTGRGQALAEFALVLPLLLLLFMMIMDFGRAIYGYHTVANAARAGGRVAAVDQDVAAITNRALSQTTGLNPDDLDVDVPPPSCAKIGCIATVTVSYEYRALTPIIGTVVGPRHLSSTTEVPIERVYDSAP